MGLLLALIVAASSAVNDARAIDIVWRQQYHETGAPPRLVWITKLDCGDGEGFLFPMPQNQQCMPVCLLGVFDPNTFVMMVARPPGFKYSTSALAHELYHAHRWRQFHNGDGDHVSDGYKPDGAVEQAERALKRAGL